MKASPRQANASRAGRYAFVALIISNLFLALGPWLVRLSDVGPVAAAFWRLALAVPLLLFLAWRGGIGAFRPFSALGVMIALGGLFFAADLAAWHFGIHLTKLANATLFGNMSSLLFAIYGFIIARMLPERHQVVALLLAAAGAGLLLGSSYELSARHLKGDLLALLAGLFYTLYLITIDKARETLKPMPVLALASAAGVLPLLLFAFALGEQVMPQNWTSVVLLALSSQVIGQGLLVYSIGHLPPIVVGLGLLTQPAVTALVGWLAYDERLSAIDGIGAILICAALVLVQMPRRNERPEPELATRGPDAHLGRHGEPDDPAP